MRRRNWLIATATALFVLQAPLCALACLPVTGSQDTASAEHGDGPCHEQAPDSTSDEPTNSHEDCGCEAAYTALVKSPDQSPLNATSYSAALLTTRIEGPLRAGAHWVAPAQQKEEDLPPPDVLLLKTTLLI